MEEVHRRTGADYFFFTDSAFNTPHWHAHEICRELIRRQLPLEWMAYCSPLDFDDELASAMVEAGCLGVEFGVDAVTEKMLSALRKPFGPSEIIRCLKAARRAEMPRAVHLLFGGPGETVQDVREAQQFLDAHASPNAVFASLGIRIYDRTPIAERARREGVISEQQDLFEPAWYVSEGLMPDPVGTLDGIARQRPEWCTPTDWTGNLLRTVQKLVNRWGERPQWRDSRNYGKYMRW